MSRRKSKSGRRKTLKIETKRKTKVAANNNSHKLKKLCSNKTSNEEKLNDATSKETRSTKKSKNNKFVNAASKVIRSKKKSNDEKFSGDESKQLFSKDKINDEKFVDDDSKILCSTNNINVEKFVKDESKLLCSKNESNAEELINETPKVQKCAITLPLRRLRRRNNRIDAATCQCEICYLEFSNKFNLRRHSERFSNPQYPCNECGTKFSTKKQLRIHVIYTHENIERPKINLSCPVCNQSIKFEAQLQAHLYHYHDGGLATICNTSFTKTKRSQKTKKSSVDHKNRSNNCTKMSNQPVGPENLNSLSTAQSPAKSVIPEKIDEIQMCTMNENSRDFPGESDNYINGVIKQPLEINTLKDKYRERSVEISQTTEEIEKTENKTEYIDTPKNDANLSYLRENTEKRDDIWQIMVENDSEKYPGDKTNLARMKNPGMSENLEIENDETSRNNEELKISKFENRKPGSAKNICAKLHNLDNDMIEVFAMTNDASKGIKTSSHDTKEKRNETGKEVSQNFEECQMTDDNEAFNGRSVNFSGNNDENKLLKMSDKFEEIKETDNPPLMNDTSLNLNEKNDEKETPLEISQNCEEIEKIDNTRPINNVNIHEPNDEKEKSVKVDQHFEDIENLDNPVFHEICVNSTRKNGSLEIFHNFGQIRQTDNTRLINNTSSREFGKYDEKKKSLEIFQSFAEIAKTDETPIVKDTSFNVAKKNIQVEKSVEISGSCKENIYRSSISDLEDDDSINGSESDESEFAEALDDIFYETFENDSKKYFHKETECTTMKSAGPQNNEGALSKFDNSVNDKTETSEILDKVDSLFAKINILPNVNEGNVQLPDISPNDKEIEKIDNSPVINDLAKIGGPADSIESDQGVMAEASVDISQETFEEDLKTFLYDNLKPAKIENADIPGNVRNTSDKMGNCTNNKSGHPFTIISALSDKVDVPSLEKNINRPEENFNIDISEEFSRNGKQDDEPKDPPILDLSGIVETKYANKRLKVVQTPGKMENNDISDGTENSSSHSFESQRNYFGFDEIFLKTLESEAASYLEEISEFERDNALRAQYACKHCYVSVTRINVGNLLSLESKNLCPEIIEKSSHRIYLCSLCPEIFYCESLRQKHINHTHTVIPSVICDRIFTNKATMRRHYRSRHSIGTNNKETCICGTNMYERQELEDHFFQHCRDTRLVKKHPNIAHRKCEPLKKMHICDNCGNDFWLKSCLDLHLLHCINAEPFVKSNSMPMEKIIRRKFGEGPTHPNERVCRICWVEFTNCKQLLMHEKIYAGSGIHRCNVCDTIFRDKRLLDAHSRSAHSLSSGAKYSCYCGICNQGFSKSTHRRVHMLHIHGDRSSPQTIDESPIVGTLQTDANEPEMIDEICGDKCNVCNKIFILRNRFIEHAVYYKSDEIIRCDICDINFQGQHSAHRHNKMTHYSDEMRNAYPYKCTICDERFLYKTHLRAHKMHVHGETRKDEIVLVDAERDSDIRSVSRMSKNSLTSQNHAARIHTCAICEMSFPSADLLVTHQMEYQSDGDFVCTRCDKKYPTASLLLDHLCLNHSSTIDGSVKCRRCDENFLTPSAWVSHIKHFHTIDAREPPEFYVEKNAQSDNDFGTKNVQLIPENRDISSGVTHKRIRDEIDGISPENAVTSNEEAGGKMENTSHPSQIGKSGKINDKKKWMCVVCSKKCRDSAELAKHMAIWADQGPYMCEICGRRFMRIRYHLKHKMNHFRRKTHDHGHFCVSCNESFDTIRLFARHKSHIHGKKSVTGQRETSGEHSALESEGNRQASLPRERLSEATERAPSFRTSTNLMYNKMEASPRPQEETIVNGVINCAPDKATDRAPSSSTSATLMYNKMAASPRPQQETIVNKVTNCASGKPTERSSLSDVCTNFGFNKILAVSRPRAETSVDKVTNCELNKKRVTGPSSAISAIFGHDKMVALPRPRNGTGANKGTNIRLNASTATTPSNSAPTILVHNKMAASSRSHGITIVNKVTNHKLIPSSARAPSHGDPAILGYNKKTDLPRPRHVTFVKDIKNRQVNAWTAIAPSHGDPAILVNDKTTPSLRPHREQNAKRNNDLPGDYRYHDFSMGHSSIVHSIVEVRNVGQKRKTIDTITIGDESPIDVPDSFSSKKPFILANTSGASINEPIGTMEKRIPTVSKQFHAVNTENPRAIDPKGSMRIIGANKAFDRTTSGHPRGLSFKCKFCNLSFDSEDSLSQHMKCIHTVISVPPIVDISDDSRSIEEKDAKLVNIANQANEIGTNCVVQSRVERSVATLVSLNSGKVQSSKNVLLTVFKNSGSAATLPKQNSERTRCETCDIVFANANLRRIHQACVHDSTALKIQRGNDLTTILPILPSMRKPRESPAGHRSLMNPLPRSSNGPMEETIIEQNQSSFDFEPTSNPALGALKVRSFAGIMKSLQRNNIRKRKNVPASIIVPAEKKPKESVYDPIAFEELCRQHNLKPRSTSHKRQIPLVTLL